MDHPTPAQAEPEDAADGDLEHARSGDHAAFARLYDRHAAVVMSICRTLLASTSARDESEDACQETFLRAFRLLHRLDAGSAFRPWVYAIARHVCSERRRAVSRRTRIEAAVTANGTGSRSSGGTGSDSGLHREQVDRLAAAMLRLPEDERLAIHIHFADPDPVGAAREALGLSRSSFYKLLALARQRLASMVEGESSLPRPSTVGIERQRSVT